MDRRSLAGVPIPVPLTALDAGVTARLQDACVDPECRDRLRALGLTDRSRLRVCQRGSPYIIEVRGTRIGLSEAVAGRVLVVVAGDEGD